jgi:hypothetical protein
MMAPIPAPVHVTAIGYLDPDLSNLAVGAPAFIRGKEALQRPGKSLDSYHAL